MEPLGRDERTPAALVIARLLDDPHRFNLFQAIGLLERHTSPGARRGGLATGDGDGETVRLTGHAALGFQSSDIQRVEVIGAADGAGATHRPGATYVLSTQAMTLAGGQGPLPQPYAELLLERLAERDYAMRDFLDIFNHRFIGFLFRSKKKHAPGLNWESLNASPLASCIRAIANFALVGEGGGDLPWLRHAGLMTAAPRSMTGLSSLLEDRFGLVVRGRQFVGGWLPIEPGDQIRLGMGAALNARRALGHRVWDQAAAIDIAFDGIDLARLRRFLPTGDFHGSLSYCVRRYLPCLIDVYLVLKTGPGARLATRLGGDGAAQLGWTSWLQESRDGGEAACETEPRAMCPSRNIPSVRLRL
ncbi:MAG: type VI secretion system baseplate subunit TssG [Janthinobacterium lividum]